LLLTIAHSAMRDLLLGVKESQLQILRPRARGADPIACHYLTIYCLKYWGDYVKLTLRYLN